MTNEKRFYTYAYLRGDGTPYYVGKGQGKRAFVCGGRRGAQTPKDKSRILFLKRSLTEEEALKHEVYMIAVLGRKDLGTGILRNLTDGGEGASGYKHVGEAKERIKKNAEKGRMAAKLKLQMSVELTNMEDGSVSIFDSARDAARAKNLNPGHLCSVCRGEVLSAGGFLARYWTPDLRDWGEGLFHMVEEVKRKKKTSWKKGVESAKKKVELTRISDGLSFSFDSLSEAARSLSLDVRSLSKVCLGQQKTHKEFNARYVDQSS